MVRKGWESRGLNKYKHALSQVEVKQIERVWVGDWCIKGKVSHVTEQRSQGEYREESAEKKADRIS